MKHISIIWLCLMCVGLAGCRIILSEEPATISSSFSLDAHVYLKRTKVLIRTETTLPPETPLLISIQPYSEDQPLRKIQTYKVEPQPEEVTAKAAYVDQEGKVEPVVMDRPDPSKRYRIKIVAGKMVKYMNLMKIEDPDGIGANLTFLSVEEIKERYQTPVKVKK
ncbi:hypothetical protein CN378_18225 [Bacillus sp. AFS015802]|uniref:hypothetical protein n=1 Tax=Bacillus sp. AFS015802 TaxID=2033486 RepID=UPI000BF6DE6F|nr:hypothetical protein [Bacillus sp. AFS015802]PFA62978.1 hypothetical protein CN378_18225 [Bacillus sp. AFS015802]